MVPPIDLYRPVVPPIDLYRPMVLAIDLYRPMVLPKQHAVECLETDSHIPACKQYMYYALECLETCSPQYVITSESLSDLRGRQTNTQMNGR